MENLPDEIIGEIIVRIPKFYLLNTVHVSKKWHKLTLIHVSIISGDDDFKEYCIGGDILSIKRTKYKFDPNSGLCGACQGGYRGLVEYMIEKGADDWDVGLEGACQGGHRELVEYMIEKGACDWDRGLYGACRGGHRGMAQFFIEKGAKNWNDGLYGACRGGHRELAELMIEKGANVWNFGLFGACSGKRRDLIDLMIGKGANNCWCRKSIENHLLAQDKGS